MKQIKKVSLIGMGAMGSFFAPRLYQAFGEDFHIIADKKRAEKLNASGVTINDKTYFFPITDPADTSEKSDLIIIATKGYSFDQAMEDIANQVKEDTLILGIINGIDAEEKLIARFGKEHVLYSLMRVSIVMKDLVTQYDPETGSVHFGESEHNIPGSYSERVKSVADVFDRAKIAYVIDEDMRRAIWYKYACNVSENLTCALLGISFGWFQKNEDANFIRKKAFLEVVAVAKAGFDIDFSDDDFIKQQQVFFNIPPQNKPSTLQDIEAGRPTEIEMFAGTMLQLGQKFSIPTPYCELFYHSIRILEQKNALAAEHTAWD
ncbi:MAG: ketopantoate reductase family protein [Lachnospiraceae bacterium]